MEPIDCYGTTLYGIGLQRVVSSRVSGDVGKERRDTKERDEFTGARAATAVSFLPQGQPSFLTAATEEGDGDGTFGRPGSPWERGEKASEEQSIG